MGLVQLLSYDSDTGTLIAPFTYFLHKIVMCTQTKFAHDSQTSSDWNCLSKLKLSERIYQNSTKTFFILLASGNSGMRRYTTATALHFIIIAADAHQRHLNAAVNSVCLIV